MLCRSDPISNLRPVIYRSKNPSSSSSASSSRPSASSSATGRSGTDYTPYSISEFSSASSSGRDRSGSDRRLGEDLAERLRKEAVDRKNHEFWVSSSESRGNFSSFQVARLIVCSTSVLLSSCSLVLIDKCDSTPPYTGKDQPPLRSSPSPPSLPPRPRSFSHHLFPRRDRPVRSGQGKSPRRVLPRLDTCQQG